MFCDPAGNIFAYLQIQRFQIREIRLQHARSQATVADGKCPQAISIDEIDRGKIVVHDILQERYHVLRKDSRIFQAMQIGAGQVQCFQLAMLLSRGVQRVGRMYRFPIWPNHRKKSTPEGVPNDRQLNFITVSTHGAGSLNFNSVTACGKGRTALALRGCSMQKTATFYLP